jgi:phage terminase large subunit-like protein
VRAEPAAALYEQQRVHHVGIFPELEDQMCGLTTDFDRQRAGYSPDRVDALVWAMRYSFSYRLRASLKADFILSCPSNLAVFAAK